MGGLLFVSQAMLDSWAEQGKIDFVGNVMTLVASDGHGRSYALQPAVRFLQVLGADRDPNGLLRKVKSLAQLRTLGAEAVDDSVVLGDAAYEVEPGFLAEANAVEAASAVRQAPAAPHGQAPHGQAWIAQPLAASSVAGADVAPPAGPRGATPLPKDLEARRKEAEALARFLLENLS
jgi:hypothetical protein